MVPVSKMLFGIHWETTDEKIDELLAGSRETLAGIRELQGELGELRELAQREFTKLFNAEQNKDDAYCPYVFVIRGSTLEGDLIGLLDPIRSTRMRERVRDAVWKGRMELQLYCQAPGCWHPLGYERGKDDPETGLYQLEVSSDFLKTVGPYLLRLVKTMKYAQPVLGAWVSWADPEKYEKQFKNDFERMNRMSEKLSTALATIGKGPEAMAEGRGGEETLERASGSILRALRRLLESKDEQRVWGGLKRVLTKEGHYLWLCGHHANEYKD